MQSQLFEDAGCPNGFPREPGGPFTQHIITSPDLTKDVVISPGLPTPPLSPLRSSRFPSGEFRASDVNGSGPTTPSFGSYYGPSHGGLTNGVQPPSTSEERLIKFSGIGPVDETGMPIASRSSVNKPRDWYKSMFKQIHKKPEECEQEESDKWSARCLQATTSTEDEDANQYLFRLSPHGALPDWSQDVNELSVPGKQKPQPKSIFDFEPQKGVSSVSLGQGCRSPNKRAEKSKSPSVEASLVSELSRFEAELDSDIMGLEKRLSQKKQQRRGWGEVLSTPLCPKSSLTVSAEDSSLVPRTQPVPPLSTV